MGSDWASMLSMAGPVVEPPQRPYLVSEDVSVEKTLPGFLMKFMRELNRACSEEELVRGASMFFANLRKPDGTRYRGDVLWSVKGALSAVAGLFEKDSVKGTWALNEPHAREYEAQVQEKISRRMASKRRQNARRSERSAEERQNMGQMGNFDKKRNFKNVYEELNRPGAEEKNMQVFNATANAASALRITVVDDKQNNPAKKTAQDGLQQTTTYLASTMHGYTRWISV
eukprot:Platyproteum_vivax@DN8349_c0_g1_i1.p2